MEYEKSDEIYELHDLYTIIENPHRYVRKYRRYRERNIVCPHIPPLNSLCTAPIPNLIVV